MNREASGTLFSYFNSNNGESAGNKGAAASRNRPTAAGGAGKSMAAAAQRGPEDAVDPVSQDKIWRQFVDGEQRLGKQWEQNWGFITEYDPKGNKKVRKELPTEASVFSEKIPNTDSGNYGNRLSTNNGQRIAQMQAQFEAHNRRTKSDKDIICY